jgi:hypothetical protein
MHAPYTRTNLHTHTPRTHVHKYIHTYTYVHTHIKRRQRRREDKCRQATSTQDLVDAGMWVDPDDMRRLRALCLQMLGAYLKVDRLSDEQTAAFQSCLIFSLYLGDLPVMRPQVYALANLEGNFAVCPVTGLWRLLIKPTTAETKRSCKHAVDFPGCMQGTLYPHARHSINRTRHIISARKTHYIRTQDTLYPHARHITWHIASARNLSQSVWVAPARQSLSPLSTRYYPPTHTQT